MAEFIVLWDIGLIIIAATLLAHISRIIKQPLIPAYIIAGILIGPLGLGIITSRDVIRSLSELGIAFLLFIVGLELDLRRLRDVGLHATITSIVTSSTMIVTGFWIARYMGFIPLEALYIGLALAFSSTMIVIKLLSDKNELDTLHGRIILGILLMQDVIAIVSLSILATLDNLSVNTVSFAFLNGLGLFSIALVTSKYIVPSIFRLISNHHELMFLTALSFFFLFAKLSSISGFSVAIGAFIAGMSIASFPYNYEIVGKVRSLRDFFAIIFFVTLGMEIWVEDINTIITPTLVFLALIVTLKPIIMMFVTSFFGYGRRVSFLTANALPQISEFSLIIVMQGLLLKHISIEVFSIVSLLALVSISLTAYLIKFDNELYRLLSLKLMVLEHVSESSGRRKILESLPPEPAKHAVVIGCHRMGAKIVDMLRKTKKNYVVVDFNPERIKILIKNGVHCIYGDVGDIDVLQKLRLDTADIVISTVSDEEDNMILIKETKTINPKTPVIVTADTVRQALELYEGGADYVVLPKILSGNFTSKLVEDLTKQPSKIDELRGRHVLELEKAYEEEILSRYEFSFIASLEEKIHGKNNKK
jgi:Kef-type K+ transport system membrane component KefB/Trk K+ transport system NAD-binding subunit